MLKLTKIMLCAGMAVSLAACAQSEPANEPEEETQEETAEETVSEPVANVTGGTVRGYVDANGVKTFKGIPYAATTEGENRFKDPQPVEAWEGEKDCTEFGPIVMQNEAAPFMCWSAEYVDGGLNYENGRMSEDSLNLNVWTTAEKGDKQPVIVYIHGGANTSGSGQNEVYTGENIAQKGVVYVTINYRVGLFGWLCYEDETGEEITGNFGIKDQVAALEWVKNNIAEFGGDPSNVTIAGQSAGSQDVQKLMICPKAEGLFRHAVAMSANAYEGFGVMGTKTAEEAKAAAKEALGQYTVADLRAMSTLEADALRAVYNPDSHVIDGEYITGTTKEAYASGDFNKADLMIGGVAGDVVLFGSFLNLPEGEEAWTEELYEAAVRNAAGDLADQMLAAYPADGDLNALVGQIAVDNANAQYSVMLSRKAANDSSNNYQWFFTRSVPDADPEVEAMWGAFHTGDVGYWLNYFSDTSKRPWKDVDYALGEQMSDYLVNFAKTGDPNGSSLPEWKKADGSVSYMHLGEESAYESMSEERNAFWQAFYANN